MIFDWIKVALLLLQISRSIIGYVERQQAISEGQRQVLAKELAQMLVTAKIAREVQTAVDGMTDAQVDDNLSSDFRP